MAVTSTTVKVRLHRARQALKTLIERELTVESARLGGLSFATREV